MQLILNMCGLALCWLVVVSLQDRASRLRKIFGSVEVQPRRDNVKRKPVRCRLVYVLSIAKVIRKAGNCIDI